jgi:hypothetical protein
MFAILGFTQISERDEGDSLAVRLGLLEDGLEVRTSHAVVFHLARIDVKITEDGYDEFIAAGLQ